jgi:hypothetical protein
MKLKEFNAENCVSIKTGTSCISINIKTGLAAINKYAAQQMELKPEDMIVIHQDEEAPENWYLEKVKAKGFPLRKKDNVSAGLFFNNSALVKSIAESVNYKEKSGRLLIAGKPTKLDKRILWGLLTISLKKAK